MSTRVVGGSVRVDFEFIVSFTCSVGSVGAVPRPRISTRVVEPVISVPLGNFVYTDRFSLQIASFVTSRELSCERLVTLNAEVCSLTARALKYRLRPAVETLRDGRLSQTTPPRIRVAVREGYRAHIDGLHRGQDRVQSDPRQRLVLDERVSGLTYRFPVGA
jgi:hypothetical protein